MEPLTALAVLAAKLKAAGVTAHNTAQMAGLMLDSETPPLCENVRHNEIDCGHSSLSPDEWCAPCLRHYAAKEGAQ